MKKINLVQKEKVEHKLEDNFLPYKESLELKKLGFDYLCFAYYVGKDEELHYIGQGLVENTSFSLNSRVAFRCPLYQQVFEFFREKHEITHSIVYNKFYEKTPYQWEVRPIWKEQLLRPYGVGGFSSSYKEAELEAIKNIIQILKEK